VGKDSGLTEDKNNGLIEDTDSGLSNKGRVASFQTNRYCRFKHKTESQFWAETLISLNIIMIMGQETLEPVETNDIEQVKIVSSAKTGKWVWVNAKQYRGILKGRLACLKWEQTRKKGYERESTWVLCKKQHSNKSCLQACGNKFKGKGKVIDDYALYSPTSPPLTWSSNLYVKELLKVKQRLEVVETKELERDCTIHRITAENRDLVESKKVLKE
jgi:hypothetical protein